MKRAAIICLVACGLGLTLFAPVSVRGEQLPIKIYTTSDGLVSNRISRIVRDSRGYMWFCTEDGLSRFDGYAFTNYTVQQGLPTNWVDDFLETRGGTFLVGTNSGLCIFDPRGDPVPRDRLADHPTARPMFSVSRPDADELAVSVKHLFEDSSGNIWCGTKAGLYRVEIADHRATYHKIDLGIRSLDTRVRSIAEDKDGALWVLTNFELFRYKPGGGAERFALEKKFSDISLMDLLKGDEGRLYLSTRAGLFEVTPPAPGARRYASEDGLACLEMTVLHRDYSGRIWAGTDYGLYEFLKDESRFQLRLGVKDIRDARVWSFSEDSFGNLWVGTANGAIRLARDGFTTFTEADGIGFREVYRISETGEGEVNLYTRFGSSNSFIDRFDGQRFSSQRILPRAFPARSFSSYQRQIPIQDHLGEWWWPTSEGLFRYGKADRIEDIINARALAHYTTKDGLPTNALGLIYEDRSGDIWVSVSAGVKSRVVRWERAANKFHVYTPADGFPDDLIPTTICDDNSGNLWVGFSQAGIARFRQGRFTSFGAAEGVPGGEIRQLLLDSHGRIWIASNNGGLGKIEDVSAERPQITAYTTADGLASNSILYVAEDRANQFYVATNRGLNHVDFNTGGVKRFTANDGLANNQVDIIFRDSRGAFWFGTVTGVSRLLPRVEPEQSAPPIFISTLKIAGEPRHVSEVGETEVKGFELAPGQNQIEIGFGSLFFGAGDSIRYQYKLEGADADWQPLSTQRTVNYANLAPGDYRFLVRAVNAEGVWSQTPSAVEFKVLAPIWQRWWFLTLAAMVAALAVYSVYRYRLARLIEVERIRTRIAADLHDDIGSNLTKIGILSEVVHQQMNGAEETVAEPISTIARISRESVTSMSDIVWAINPRRDSLRDLVSHMREFAGEMFANCEIEFEFLAPSSDVYLRLGADVRRTVFLIFKEGVNNIVRHADCSKACIELRVEGAHLVLKVADDGRGFDRTEGAGNGLLSIERRAAAAGGMVEIASSKSSGTKITLRLPIKQRSGVRSQGRL
jgi:ligand-binding sensor domain-containing protein/signal transduction histidine kinase